jgi:gluconate 2-dehydrogenase gamma chain
MDRRKYLKTLALGTVSTGVLVESCAPEEKKGTDTAAIDAAGPDRSPAELEKYRKLMSETFFNEHEMKTITVLSDIIIPKDDVSGSATDAKVPEFIEFIVKDMPSHQLPMRGGLKWLDLQCMKRFDKSFVECTSTQQIEVVDDIAFPEQAKPGMEQGVAFFNRMRDLTACGFFTSQIGINDLGYAGNKPNRWNGVPKEILEEFGLKYDEKTLKESVSFDET